MKRKLYHKADLGTGIRVLLLCALDRAGCEHLQLAAVAAAPGRTHRLRCRTSRLVAIDLIGHAGLAVKLSNAAEAHRATCLDYWRKHHAV